MVFTYPMPIVARSSPLPSPVAIGGVGGSGTRVVASALALLGFAIGRDCNQAQDNLGFTLLFKDEEGPLLGPEAFARRVRIFIASMTGGRSLSSDELALLETLSLRPRPQRGPVQHDPAWLRQRATALAAQAAGPPLPAGTPWGWKEPNTHVVLPQLLQALPELRYVHVQRNGLDMALSRNLNQLSVWGGWWLGRPVEPGPRDALAYWCAVHRRTRALAALMGPRFLWVDYDALCARPRDGMAALARFLDAGDTDVDDLARLVRPSEGTPRRERQALEAFRLEDLDYLREIGHL